jgi:hypothetical protein
LEVIAWQRKADCFPDEEWGKQSAFVFLDAMSFTGAGGYGMEMLTMTVKRGGMQGRIAEGNSRQQWR